jgi:hypothetical protein
MKRAKRTQFGDRGLHDCGLKGTGRDGVHAKRTQFGGRIVRNEPNFASSQAADREDCAKRSQTWGDWGMWTKVVGEWGVPGRGVKRAKRTQFGPAAGGRRRRNLRNEPNFAPAAGVSRSQNAQNEPNLARRDTGCPDRGVRCEVSSVKSEKSGIPSLTSHFKHQTSHFPTANRAKQDAHDKSPQVGLRPAFWGGYRRSIRLTPTFVVSVKQTQFARRRM